MEKKEALELLDIASKGSPAGDDAYKYYQALYMAIKALERSDGHDNVLASIEEVQEGGKRLANHYLSHGYILLDIQTGARAEAYAGEGASGRQYYVRRNPIFVLGRPRGVKPAEAPPKRSLIEKATDKEEHEQ